VESPFGSREEVLGERKPVIRDDDGGGGGGGDYDDKQEQEYRHFPV